MSDEVEQPVTPSSDLTRRHWRTVFVYPDHVICGNCGKGYQAIADAVACLGRHPGAPTPTKTPVKRKGKR